MLKKEKKLTFVSVAGEPFIFLEFSTVVTVVVTIIVVSRVIAWFPSVHCKTIVDFNLSYSFYTRSSFNRLQNQITETRNSLNRIQQTADQNNRKNF